MLLEREQFSSALDNVLLFIYQWANDSDLFAIILEGLAESLFNDVRILAEARLITFFMLHWHMRGVGKPIVKLQLVGASCYCISEVLYTANYVYEVYIFTELKWHDSYGFYLSVYLCG